MVYLLGVLSLLALSITADTETSLTALHREVREAGNVAQGRLKKTRKKKSRKGRKLKATGRKAARIKERKEVKGKGKRGEKIKGRRGRNGKKERKSNGKKGKKASNANGLEGKQRKDGKGKKSTKGKGRKQGKGKIRRGRKNKEGKRERKEGNKRHNLKNGKTRKNLRNEKTCNKFFTATNAKDLRYAQNQQTKSRRINAILRKLDKKRDKSADAFLDAAEFFRDCPAGSSIYNVLRFEMTILLCCITYIIIQPVQSDRKEFL